MSLPIRGLLLATLIAGAWPSPATASRLTCTIPSGKRYWGRGEWAEIATTVLVIRPELLSSPKWQDWRMEGTVSGVGYGPSAMATQTSRIIRITSDPQLVGYEKGVLDTHQQYALSIDKRSLVATLVERVAPTAVIYVWKGACLASP